MHDFQTHPAGWNKPKDWEPPMLKTPPSYTSVTMEQGPDAESEFVVWLTFKTEADQQRFHDEAVLYAGLPIRKIGHMFKKPQTSAPAAPVEPEVPASES